MFGHVFEHFRYNRKYSSYNESSYFEDRQKAPNALSLNRVFFITTENSASASESVISALRASENHMEVVIVGGRTYGKPYAMYPIAYCDRVFFPILMKNFNSDFAEDYDNGFEPTCQASDDLRFDYGDPRESSVKEAIYYLQHGTCSH